MADISRVVRRRSRSGWHRYTVGLNLAAGLTVISLVLLVNWGAGSVGGTRASQVVPTASGAPLEMGDPLSVSATAAAPDADAPATADAFSSAGTQADVKSPATTGIPPPMIEAPATVGSPATAGARLPIPAPSGGASSTMPSSGTAPASKSRWFGVSIAGLSQLNSVDGLAGALGRRLDVVDFYSGWTSGFPEQGVSAIAGTGALPEITWEPWDYRLGLNQDTYSLTAIAAGSFDAYVEQWAAAAAAWKKPILVRFAHEMNSNWYPWAVGVNGNTAAAYVAAYRHVHAIFARAGATNVSWIWSPNVIYRPGSDPAPMYPGPDVVDLVGVDGYNPGTGVPGGWWPSPPQLFGQTLAAFAVLAPNKPILVAETGSSETGGSKAAWIAGLLSYLAGQPNVVGFVWSEYVGRADWPIESSASSEASMKASLATY